MAHDFPGHCQPLLVTLLPGTLEGRPSAPRAAGGDSALNMFFGLFSRSEIIS